MHLQLAVARIVSRQRVRKRAAGNQLLAADADADGAVGIGRRLNVRQLREIFQILFARIHQVVGSPAGSRGLGNLSVKAGNVGQQLVGGSDVSADRSVELAVQRAQILRRLVETGRERLRRVDERLSRRRIGRAGRHALKGVEQIVQPVGQIGRGRRAGGSAAGAGRT